MKLLITGSNGFIGKNLVSRLLNSPKHCILPFDTECPPAILDCYLSECDAVIHLAGINRSDDDSQFFAVNKDFTAMLLQKLQHFKKNCPVIATSSILATQDNIYGKSKKAMEEELLSYSQNTGAKTIIYRLQNVFGKWCKPQYNSVIATFCHQIANEKEITVDDSEKALNLVYIDDVVDELLRAAQGCPTLNAEGFGIIPTRYCVKLGEIAKMLQGFKLGRKKLFIPCVGEENQFEKKLYSTYLSYLPDNDFAYQLDCKRDDRGYFCEVFKSSTSGQVSISKTKPGVTRGNHRHNTKVEKFLVTQGEAIIRLKKTGENEILQYRVSEDCPVVVDIPPGYTHSIENIGDDDLVTVIWCNELFDPENPDVYFEEV